MNIYLQLKLMFDAMHDAILPPPTGSRFAKGTPMKKGRPLDRQNHNQGESKARRKLAAKSNRINRHRVNRWKH